MTAKKARSMRVLDLALILILVMVLIATIAWLWQLARRIESLRASLSEVESAFGSGPEIAGRLLQDPDEWAVLQDAVARFEADLDAVDHAVRPVLPLAGYLGWLPGIGGDVAAAPPLLEMARETGRAANLLLESLAPLAQRLDEASESPPGLGRLVPDLVSGLDAAGPQLASAQAALARAAQARQEINRDDLSRRTQSLVDRFDRYQPLLQDGVQMLAVLPELLGAGDPRSYLLLAQNNQELRATGGFISGVGRITVDGGEITSLNFQDSYSVDDLAQPHPPAPDPLRRHMGAGMLLLRDANWWPDFAVSARTVAGLYRQDQGHDVDGVIAVDLSALRLLLEATGPIEIPGYDQPVSSANLQSMLAAYWEAPLLGAPGKEGTDWWLHRKDLAGDLLSALVQRLMTQAGTGELIALSRAAGRAFQERHIAAYVNNSAAQEALVSLGWAGTLPPADGDYLMIVDSNVGFNKANPNVEQTANYEVSLDGNDQATATLTLTYRHRVERPAPACVHESRYGDSYEDLLERCYWDYVRVYVPAGSEVLEVAGADEPAQVYEESGRTVVATSLLLQTGESRRIEIRYRPHLPPGMNGYTLLVQKQPGAEAMALRISVTPPRTLPPTAYDPPGWVWLDGRAVWQGHLTTDLRFSLAWN